MKDKNVLINESCLRIIDRAWEYFASEMSPLERNRIDLHLVECADCRMQFEQIRLLHLTIENQKTQLANPFLTTRILSLRKGKAIGMPGNSIRAEVFAILVIALFVLGGVFTGSFFAGKYIQTDEIQLQSNGKEIFADQKIYDETDCIIPGYEILNDKP